jgi:peptidoglycan/xylan/chitin deacetylase (PgdA/CDA1 family)
MALRLPILTFHDIDERPSVISISPDVFQRIMKRLTEAGYVSISLSKIAECVGKAQPFPDRALGITFDDGFRSVYDKAFPVLQEYGMSATVFLTVGAGTNGSAQDRLPSYIGREMLRWPEIREMARGGIDFGGHTQTHPDLTRLPMDRAHEEICAGKSVIEDVLGSPVTAFAYPFGYHDARIREIVRKYYACACSGRLGMARTTSDPFALERVDMYYFRKERLFRVMGTRSFPLYVRLLSVPRQLRSLVTKGRWL